MARVKGTLRDTRWLWSLLVGLGVVLGAFVDRVLFLALPISLFAFIVFGYMRYDVHGKPLQE